MKVKKININKISKELLKELKDLGEGEIDSLLEAIGFSTREAHAKIIEFEDKIGVLVKVGEEKLKKILEEYKERGKDKKGKVEVNGKKDSVDVRNVEEKVIEYSARIKKEDGKIKAFLHLNENAIEDAKGLDKKAKDRNGKMGRLYGKIIAVKSNINVKGMICNCASKTLEDYKSGFDASVIEKIKKEDGVIIGMTNMDEFAAGSSGENSAFGATQNPIVLGRIAGGSSSGSAASVAAGFCDVSLGSDTGGSIRNPASHCGVIGVKPSYGRVSRYGLIDLSMSLDQIGVFAKNADDAILLMDVIKGKDERDATSEDFGDIKLEKIGKLNVGVVYVKGVDKRIQDLINKKIEDIKKKLKWNMKDVKIEHIDLAVQTYYLLVYVEFFSATRRFDGRRYGKKIEESCGEEVLRRILGGSEITKAEFKGAYYKKTLEVKEIIKEEFENVLKKVDCLIMPTFPMLPWKIGEGNKMKIEEIYAADALTIPANLAEICAVSIPTGKIDGIPVGMQIMCAKGQEGKMLSIAREIERL